MRVSLVYHARSSCCKHAESPESPQALTSSSPSNQLLMRLEMRAGGSECVRQLHQGACPANVGRLGAMRCRGTRQAELPLHRPSTTAQTLAALPHQLSCRLDSQELNKTFTTVNCLRVLHAMFANGAIVTGGRRCSGSRSANRGEPFQEGTQVG